MISSCGASLKGRSGHPHSAPRAHRWRPGDTPRLVGRGGRGRRRSSVHRRSLGSPHRGRSVSDTPRQCRRAPGRAGCTPGCSRRGAEGCSLRQGKLLPRRSRSGLRSGHRSPHSSPLHRSDLRRIHRPGDTPRSVLRRIGQPRSSPRGSRRRGDTLRRCSGSDRRSRARHSRGHSGSQRRSARCHRSALRRGSHCLGDTRASCSAPPHRSALRRSHGPARTGDPDSAG